MVKLSFQISSKPKNLTWQSQFWAVHSHPCFQEWTVIPRWSWTVEWVLTALTLSRSSVKAVLTYSKQLEAKVTWSCVCIKYKLRFQGTEVMHWQQLHWKQRTEFGSRQYLEFTPIKQSPWKQSRQQQGVILRICAWGRCCPAELHTSAMQLELHTTHAATAPSSEVYRYNQSTCG